MRHRSRQARQARSQDRAARRHPGVNLAAGTVSLDNPWNGSGVGAGVAMQFTDSIATLAKDGVTFFAAKGAAAVA